jgi:hypothetical protein
MTDLRKAYDHIKAIRAAYDALVEAEVDDARHGSSRRAEHAQADLEVALQAADAFANDIDLTYYLANEEDEVDPEGYYPNEDEVLATPLQRLELGLLDDEADWADHVIDEATGNCINEDCPQHADKVFDIFEGWVDDPTTGEK